MPPLQQPAPYVGRFAPSPTGPLHFGSLLAALASFLDARAHGGRWLLRIEDIDPLREVPGAADRILHILDAFGLHWDGPVHWQHDRQPRYLQALETLHRLGVSYYCRCSRQDIGQRPQYHREHCRRQRVPPDGAWSLRIRAPDETLHFHDLIQGPQSHNLARDGDDFVVFRKDGLVAYQLATAVDDAEAGITRVVRGSDLLDSTFRQCLLMRWLGHTPPQYAHLPVATTASGQKLSKQNHAPPLSAGDWHQALPAALACLGQPLPDAEAGSPGALLAWATAHWSLAAVPAVAAIPAPPFGKHPPA